MKIVFMGTPDFAVATLDAIYKTGYEIAAVVTTPDKPSGRGQQIHYSDVKKYALEKNLRLLQPEKLKDPIFIETLRGLNAELFVVVAFRMLPESVYIIPPLGTFNIHASLLPNYRGAAPIHWAVMNGETKTGVTSFFLNNDIDKGDIIDFREVSIGENETTGELYDRLKMEGASLAVDTIKSIENGSSKLIPQTSLREENIKLAPKIEKEDTLIDWNQPAKIIFNKIRGLSPSPGAYTKIKNINGEESILKCFQAKVSDEKSVFLPGTITTDKYSNFSISTKDFQILLQNVQLEGKRRMEIKMFLAGFKSENYILKLF